MHSGLKELGYQNLHQCLQKQTVHQSSVEDFKNYQNESEILSYVQKNCVYLKNAKEVTFVKETLNATLYSVQTANSLHKEVIIKIPRRVAKESLNGFDLICSTQLFSVLKRLEPNSNFEPELFEEIFTVDD